MEKANMCHRHEHVVFISGFNDVVIANGTACLGNVIYPAAMSPFDIVTEGEECIATERYAVQFP